MNPDNKNKIPTEQSRPVGQKQIHMNVDGCTVTINIAADKSKLVAIETVKRMILSGLAKA